MNKIELINAVAEETNLSKKDAEAAITAVVNAITGALIEGEKVQLVGFGSFEVKRRAERVGRNPRTQAHTLHLGAPGRLHRGASRGLPRLPQGLPPPAPAGAVRERQDSC